LVLFIFAIAASSVAAQKSKPLDPIYDKGKDETTFFLSPMLEAKVDVFSGAGGVNLGDGAGVRPVAAEVLKMLSYVKFPGKAYTTPENVTLAFQSYHYRAFQYGTFRDLVVKTPDHEYKFGAMKLTERKSAGDAIGFYETLELPIPLSQYREIVGANRVDVSVGATSFRLTKDQISSLQTIASKYLK